MPISPEMVADGWVEHDGGPCPVDQCTDALLRNGIIGMVHPFNSRWLWGDSHWDIIAYRSEPKP